MTINHPQSLPQTAVRQVISNLQYISQMMVPGWHQRAVAVGVVVLEKAVATAADAGRRCKDPEGLLALAKLATLGGLDRKVYKSGASRTKKVWGSLLQLSLACSLHYH